MVGKSREKIKHSLFSRFFVVLVILVSILLIFGIAREYMSRNELDNEINQLEDELQRLKVQKKDFLSSIESYDSDFFVEQEARTKFDMKKPNEQVVIIPISGIVNNQDNNSDVLDSNKQMDQNQLNIMQWWQYFFGIKS